VVWIEGYYIIAANGDREIHMNQAEAIQKSTTTFNAAADYFDAPALSFWNRFGQNTVERIQLQPGAKVLDVYSRGTLDQLDPATQARVRSINMQFLRDHNIQALDSERSTIIAYY
jgi:hypothetical protein